MLVRDVEVRKPAMPVSAAATIRPVTSPMPTPEFRVSQSTRVQEVAAHAPPKPVPAPNTKDCPHCTANLPLQATNCRCGYNFGHAAELPALSLSSTELASILGALSGLSPSGNR